MNIKTTNGNSFISWKWVTGIMVLAVMSLVGSWAANVAAKIESIEEDSVASARRISALEEAVSTIKSNNTEIRDDIKQILKMLK